MKRSATHKTFIIQGQSFKRQVRPKGRVKGRKGRNGFGYRVILDEERET